MLGATLVKALAVLALGPEFNCQRLQAFHFPLNKPQCTVIVFSIYRERRMNLN